MNMIINPALHGLCILLVLSIATAIAHAQKSDNKKQPAVIWINSWYGPNHSGIGLAGRYDIAGIGATVFGFTGDPLATRRTVMRPGQIGINVDGYFFADFSSWIALYLNMGVVARLDTYRRTPDSESYDSHEAASGGGGFQVSLASHLVLGIGYNITWDTEGTPRYYPIHSIVAQIGYRL